MTDHGNMFGALDFYKKAKEHGVKPIFGCETYVAPDRRDKTERRNNHLILLAKNNDGYKNLRTSTRWATSRASTTTRASTSSCCASTPKGLIGLSACLGGEVAQTLHAARAARRPRRRPREFQRHLRAGQLLPRGAAQRLPEQEKVNGRLIEMSSETGIPLVATSDCHYLNQDDARAHEILMCMQQKQDDRRRQAAAPPHRRLLHQVAGGDGGVLQAHPRGAGERRQHRRAVQRRAQARQDLPADLPGARRVRPPTATCARSPRTGLERRFEEAPPPRRQVRPRRLPRRGSRSSSTSSRRWSSPATSSSSGTSSTTPRSTASRSGPGRGSGAGSIVAYALRITDLDPIPYNLLFERFLNPERVSMPDFDIDFCMDRRDEVIKYVAEKYGKDNVGQIVTLHQLKARSVHPRRRARAWACPYAEADKVAKLVPEPVQGKMPAHRRGARARAQAQGALRRATRPYRELLEHGQGARGAEPPRRHARRRRGDHREPAVGVRAVLRPAGDDDGIVTQYDKDDVEKAGLVKFDFLGLKTLTVIRHRARPSSTGARRARRGATFDLAPSRSTTPSVYKLISAATPPACSSWSRRASASC